MGASDGTRCCFVYYRDVTGGRGQDVIDGRGQDGTGWAGSGTNTLDGLATGQDEGDYQTRTQKVEPDDQVTLRKWVQPRGAVYRRI